MKRCGQPAVAPNSTIPSASSCCAVAPESKYTAIEPVVLSDTRLSQCTFNALTWKPSLELDSLMISKTSSLNSHPVPSLLHKTSLVTPSTLSGNHNASLAFAPSLSAFIHLLLLRAAYACSLEPMISSSFPRNGSDTAIACTALVVSYLLCERRVS